MLQRALHTLSFCNLCNHSNQLHSPYLLRVVPYIMLLCNYKCGRGVDRAMGGAPARDRDDMIMTCTCMERKGTSPIVVTCLH